MVDGEEPSFPYTQANKQRDYFNREIAHNIEIEQPLRQNFSDSVFKKQCKL